MLDDLHVARNSAVRTSAIEAQHCKDEWRHLQESRDGLSHHYNQRYVHICLGLREGALSVRLRLV